MPGPGDEDPATEQRQLLEPAEPIAERHHGADDDEGRRRHSRRADAGRELGQGGGDRLLLAVRGPLDDRGRRRRVLAGSQEMKDDPLEPRHPHVDDQRPGEAGQGVPVEGRLVLRRVLVAGHDRDAAGMGSMRQRNAGKRRRPESRGHAGDDFKRDAGRLENLRLLAAPAEDRRIAAFEPDDAAAPVARRRRRSP